MVWSISYGCGCGCYADDSTDVTDGDNESGEYLAVIEIALECLDTQISHSSVPILLPTGQSTVC